MSGMVQKPIRSIHRIFESVLRTMSWKSSTRSWMKRRGLPFFLLAMNSFWHVKIWFGPAPIRPSKRGSSRAGPLYDYFW